MTRASREKSKTQASLPFPPAASNTEFSLEEGGQFLLNKYSFSGEVLLNLLSIIVLISCLCTFHYTYRLCQLLSCCVSASNPRSTINFASGPGTLKPYFYLLEVLSQALPIESAKGRLQSHRRRTCFYLSEFHSSNTSSPQLCQVVPVAAAFPTLPVRLLKPLQRCQHALSHRCLLVGLGSGLAWPPLQLGSVYNSNLFA